MKYRIATLAAGAVLALSALAPALPVSAAPARPAPSCCLIHTVLTVIHKETGPGGQLIPFAYAQMTVQVPAPPPRGGTITAVLEYRRGVVGRWKFAGRTHWGNPWHVGDHTRVIEYVCIYNHSYWRIAYSWDLIQSNGKKDANSGDWPPFNKLGKKLTCVVIEGAHAAHRG